jgi:hypothetical protein
MAKPVKGHKTYWVDTNRTASMIMTTNSIVIWSGWGRVISGRTITAALSVLSKRERYVKLRKVLNRHYFSPKELMDV